jgi:polar amino acid transport system permease protein
MDDSDVEVPLKRRLQNIFDPLIRVVNVDRGWILVAVVVLIILGINTIKDGPYHRITNYVMDGILVTVLTTITSFILVLVAGLIVALLRLSSSSLLRTISTVYVEVVRGIPLLVQLLFWYFAFPSMVQDLGDRLNYEPFKLYSANAIAMAILGLSFCYAAYMSEVYRAGIQSIPKGQMEAARSLGMSYFQAMRYIIIPQAIRVILPPVGNEFISLLKDSSLVSVVAVADLTRRGREFMARNFNPLETWSMVALLYLVMTLLSARMVNWAERVTKLER